MTKRIVSAILSIGILTTVGFLGCDKKETATVEPDKPTIEQYDGTIIQTGGTYDLASKMAFMSDVNPASDTFAPISANIKAEVYPADADQRVIWKVKGFKNTSTWTQGKNANDYVKITTAYNNDKLADIKCVAPFAMQIIIECASVENPAISATCTLDFVQAVKGVRAHAGDINFNIGGTTNITWEINPNSNNYYGGPLMVFVDTYDAYTISKDYTTKVDLISPEYYNTGIDDALWGVTGYISGGFAVFENAFNDGYLKIESDTAIYNSGLDDNNRYKKYEKEIDFYVKRQTDIAVLSFNQNFIEENLLWMQVLSSNAMGQQFFAKTISEYSTNYDIQLALLQQLTEMSLYTMRVTVTENSLGYEEEFLSLIKVGEFTNTPSVRSVTLSESSLQF